VGASAARRRRSSLLLGWLRTLGRHFDHSCCANYLLP
jgi:hypothetical protein